MAEEHEVMNGYHPQRMLDFFEAAMEGVTEDLVAHLDGVKPKCDIDVPDCHGFGFTVLIKCAQYGRLEAVKMLLERGADVTAVTAAGYSALHLATRGNCPEIVELLLAKGAPLECEAQYKRTPLHSACEYETATWMVPMLIKAGANLDAVDEMGRTPLHYSGWHGTQEVAKALVEAGAKYDIVDKYGCVAQKCAQWQGKKLECLPELPKLEPDPPQPEESVPP